MKNDIEILQQIFDEVSDCYTQFDNSGQWDEEPAISKSCFVDTVHEILQARENPNKLFLDNVSKGEAEALLKKQADWLMTSTSLSTEAIVEFENKFKQ